MASPPDLSLAGLRAYLAASAPADLASAYCFGSRAAGRAHRESDVDVGILVAHALTERERFDLRVRLASELTAALHENEVDVVVLNDAPPLLARRIVIEGERVFCRDDEADHAFRRDVQLRAADLAPFVERARRALLAGLAG